MNNHVIDPTYFYDAINEFSFDYTCYVLTSKDIDEYGKIVSTYTTKTISGSLQTEGTTLNQGAAGNTHTLAYNFYCKSKYRINIGDVIVYCNNYLRCVSMHDYDEYGVREARLEMIQLSAYRDLQEYIEYEEGRKIV